VLYTGDNLRLKDKSSLSAVSYHETVDDVVQLAAKATPLIQVTQHLLCLRAVLRMLHNR